MICVTIDTDWVPDFILEYTLELLNAYDVRATIFCTSPYDVKLLHNHEIALHPNLMEDSTTGNNEYGRMDYIHSIYPSAIGVRTHRLFWHSNLIPLFIKFGIKYDSSLFCPLQKNLIPYFDFGITRFPLWWVDTFHCRSRFAFDHFAPPGIKENGLKVLLFHPIHIFLNSTSLEDTRRKISNINLHDSTQEEFSALKNAGFGIETVFISALKDISSVQHHTLSELLGSQYYG